MPSPVTITQNGTSHGGEVFGTFAASSHDFCASGTWRDALGQRNGNQVRVERTHVCDDGTGTVVFLYTGITENLSGVGTWRIVSGTGRYVGLRGRGTTSNVHSYDPVSGSGAFVNTWRGVMDFDTVAPTAQIGRPQVRRIPARRLARVAIRVLLADNVATNLVGYEATLYVPGRGVLASRAGVRRGAVALSFIVRLPAVRRAVVEVVARDPVGNTRTVRRVVIVRP